MGGAGGGGRGLVVGVAAGFEMSFPRMVVTGNVLQLQLQLQLCCAK